MDYTLALPMFVVTLPCNHEFRSRWRVTAHADCLDDVDLFDAVSLDDEPDAEDITWLYCRTCRKDYAVQEWELEEYQEAPRDSAGRRLSESQLEKRYFDALTQNKIAADLLRTDETQDVIAARYGVSDRTVRKVYADLRARRGDVLEASGRTDAADPFDLVTAA